MKILLNRNYSKTNLPSNEIDKDNYDDQAIRKSLLLKIDDILEYCTEFKNYLENTKQQYLKTKIIDNYLRKLKDIELEMKKINTPYRYK